MIQELTINVSGVCTGSIGLMGTAGTIIEKETNECIYLFQGCKGSGTIFEAAFMAVEEALKEVLFYKPEATIIIVQSDSHFLVDQLQGNRELSDEGLLKLRGCIFSLIDQLGCEVCFKWLPTEKNRLPFALASKSIQRPVAPIIDNHVVEWQPSSEIKSNDMLHLILPEVNPCTILQIDSLNKTNNCCPTALISLLSNGMDKYSRATLTELLQYVEIRHGEVGRDYLCQALLDCEPNYTKAVLRWAARGLNPNLALMKAYLELQIKDY